MRLALLIMFAAAPLQAQSVCHYDRKARIAEMLTPYCASGQLVFYSISANHTPSCGIKNTFSMFSAACRNPCDAALKGIKNYRTAKGKIVIFGPTVLPTGGENSKWAFGAYKGSCYDLKSTFDSKSSPDIDDISDDDLIGAGDSQ
jgi:hypothetical protein